MNLDSCIFPDIMFMVCDIMFMVCDIMFMVWDEKKRGWDMWIWEWAGEVKKVFPDFIQIHG